MKQLDLDGDILPYHCKTCGHASATMQESSRHHATKHRTKTQTKTSVNFALENYCLISTKLVIAK